MPRVPEQSAHRLRQELAADPHWIRSKWVTVALCAVVSLAVLRMAGVSFLGWQAWLRKPVPVAAQVAPLTAPTFVGATIATPRGTDSSVSKTPLALVLAGTEPGRTPQEGLARIGVYRDSPQTYVAGASLENGTRLVEVYGDSVVLERAGLRVRLYLDPERARKAVLQQSDASLLTVGGVALPAAAAATTREVLTDYLRPSPVYERQVLVGYEVYPGSRAAPFSQMGLKPGDVITALDGVPLNDQATAWAALQQLAQGTSVVATVKRGGSTEQLVLDGALIANAELQSGTPPAPPPGGPQT